MYGDKLFAVKVMLFTERITSNWKRLNSIKSEHHEDACDEDQRLKRHYQKLIRKIEQEIQEDLKAGGLKIVDYTGQEYTPEILAKPINLENFKSGDKLYVAHVWEPVIIDRDGNILRNGVVSLGKVGCPDDDEEMAAFTGGPEAKSNLDRRLERLKQSPIPPPKLQAMCYSPLLPRLEDVRTVSFICPVCGTNTVHRVYPGDDLLSLDEIRDCAQEIRDMGFEIYLEERCFCSKCSGEISDNPAWRITIGDRTFYVDFYYWRDDCELLKKFLRAKNKSDFDRLMMQIDGDTSRLEVLLGEKPAP